MTEEYAESGKAGILVVEDEAIIATNTSTLPVIEMAVETHRPENVCGVHFFNPVAMMPLVEIVRGEHTTNDVVDTIFNLYQDMHKRPIICQKEALGFIVNRLQLALWREAFSIVQRGIASPQDVDRAVKDSFGRRLGMVGPFELYEYIDTNPMISLHPSEYTNDPFNIAQNDNMISINAAIEVDLSPDQISELQTGLTTLGYYDGPHRRDLRPGHHRRCAPGADRSRRRRDFRQ